MNRGDAMIDHMNEDGPDARLEPVTDPTPWYQTVGWWEGLTEDDIMGKLAAEPLNELAGDWSVVPPVVIDKLFTADWLNAVYGYRGETIADATADLARELVIEAVKANKVISQQYVEQAWNLAESFYKRGQKSVENREKDGSE